MNRKHFFFLDPLIKNHKMASALLMLLPAAAAAYGLSQNQMPKKQTTAPPEAPAVVAESTTTPAASYRTNQQIVANAKPMTDFQKNHSARPAASRYLRNQGRRNDGPAAIPMLASAQSLYGQSVYNSNLYNAEPTTKKVVGTFKDSKGNVFQQYEDKMPDPTGIYHRNTSGRNRLQNMIGEDDLFKRTKRDAVNFNGSNDLVRTDILPMNTRSRAVESMRLNIQNNLNGCQPSNTNQVTRAPFGMAMEGGHFMLRPKPRLPESMRYEASKVEEANPRDQQSNIDLGGATLRGKMRSGTDKTAKGRKGNKRSEVDAAQTLGEMTHCRDGTAAMKINPLMQIDTQQPNPYGSYGDVKLSKNRGMKGGNKVAQVDTFGAKTRDTKSVSCTNRTRSKKRNPTLMVGEYGAEARDATYTKDNTKRSMKKYRAEVEEALTNGVVLRAKNPCMIDRTAVGPEAMSNRDVLQQGQSAIGEHAVKRQNSGHQLRQQHAAPTEGTTASMDVGGPERTKDLTMGNRITAGSFEKHTRANPLLRETPCHANVTLPLRHSMVSGNRMEAISTSKEGDYLN